VVRAKQCRMMFRKPDELVSGSADAKARLLEIAIEPFDGRGIGRLDPTFCVNIILFDWQEHEVLWFVGTPERLIYLVERMDDISKRRGDDAKRSRPDKMNELVGHKLNDFFD
jgi:hypothetical protein